MLLTVLGVVSIYVQLKRNSPVSQAGSTYKCRCETKGWSAKEKPINEDKELEIPALFYE